MMREPTSEEEAAIFRAIGEINLRWARMELTINLLIGGIRAFAGGRHVEAEIPLMMSRRLRFLRKCFREIDALSAFKDEAPAIFDMVSETAKVRELLAHGGCTGVSVDQDALMLHFTMLRPAKGMQHYQCVEERA